MSILNKFKIVFNIVEHILDTYPEFETKYEGFLERYFEADSSKKIEIVLSEIDDLIKNIDEIFYIENYDKEINVIVKDLKLNINYEDTVAILKTSVRTRFFIFVYLAETSVNEYGELLSEQVSLFPDQQKVFQKIICNEILEMGVIDKFNSIIESLIKRSRPEGSGAGLWSLLGANHGYSPSGFAVELLTSIVYKGLTSMDPKENPIYFLISIAKNELDWMLRTILPTRIIPNSSVDLTDIINSGKVTSFESSMLYTITTKKIFDSIFSLYAQYDEVRKYNTNILLFHLSQPLINKIFQKICIRDLTTTSGHELNFFVHQFLSIHDPYKVIMKSLLISAPTFDDSKKEYSVIPEILSKRLKKNLEETGLDIFNNKITQKHMFNNLSLSLLYLYKQKYYDVLNKCLIDIDWNLFVDEYSDYCRKIVSDGYIEGINTSKREIFLSI